MLDTEAEFYTPLREFDMDNLITIDDVSGDEETPTRCAVDDSSMENYSTPDQVSDPNDPSKRNNTMLHSSSHPVSEIVKKVDETTFARSIVTPGIYSQETWVHTNGS